MYYRILYGSVLWLAYHRSLNISPNTSLSLRPSLFVSLSFSLSLGSSGDHARESALEISSLKRQLDALNKQVHHCLASICARPGPVMSCLCFLTHSLARGDIHYS